MMKKFLIIAISALTLMNGTIYSSSYEADSDAVSNCGEKVYIDAEQLVCSDGGIFVLLEDENGYLSKILIPQVNWDQNGLFVLSAYIPLPEAAWCRRGHKACSRCYKCNVPGCPSYGCKCRR